jgi:hypothetical protein
MQRRFFLATLPALALAQDFTLHNVTSTPATLKGKSGQKLLAVQPEGDHLALLNGVEFSNGTIEVDIAGEPAPGAGAAARGFVGVAFRVQPDRKTYDCFYIRPTNGRADDQERRNHAVQYISHPTYTWSKLRQETPSRYEAYADMLPSEWVHLKIEVDGVKARLYVNNATQPTLLVNDLKTGPSARGQVGIWFEGSTIAHYADLKVTPR